MYLHVWVACKLFGARGRTRTGMSFRTGDFKSPMYTISSLGLNFWCADLELNQDSADYESEALPLSYQRMYVLYKKHSLLSTFIAWRL